jgi:hypothetical protein
MKPKTALLAVRDSNYKLYCIDNARFMEMFDTVILQRTREGIRFPFIGYRLHRSHDCCLSLLLIEFSGGNVKSIWIFFFEKLT